MALDDLVEIAVTDQHRLDSHAGEEGDLVEHRQVLGLAGGDEEPPAPMIRAKGDREDSTRADEPLRHEPDDLRRNEPFTDLSVLDAMLAGQLGQQFRLGHELERYECITEPTAPLLLVCEGEAELHRVDAARPHEQLTNRYTRRHTPLPNPTASRTYTIVHRMAVRALGATHTRDGAISAALRSQHPVRPSSSSRTASPRRRAEWGQAWSWTRRIARAGGAQYGKRQRRRQKTPVEVRPAVPTSSHPRGRSGSGTLAYPARRRLPISRVTLSGPHPPAAPGELNTAAASGGPF